MTIGRAARRSSLGLVATLLLLAPIAPSAGAARDASVTTGAATSCRAALRNAVLADFPSPPGCKPIETSWVVGFEDPLVTYVSARGKPGDVVDQLKSKLEAKDLRVRNSTPRGGKCQPEDVLRIGIKKVTCAELSVPVGGITIQVLAIACGDRSQIEISDPAQRSEYERVVRPCLDPKGTGAAVKKAEAERALLDSLCAEPLSIYEQPHLLYPIDQLEVPGLSIDLSVGLNELTSSASCQALKIEGVLALAPDQESWRTPAEYADKARSGMGGGSVFVSLRVRDRGTVGWAPLESSTAFLPTQPGREYLEALPILSPEPIEATGGADLAITAEPFRREGDACTPGFTNNHWVVALVNAGSGATPEDVSIEVTVPGLSPETTSFRWTRGLAPGEAFQMNNIVVDAGNLNVGTRIRLDPGNEVQETNESNNDQTLGPLEVLTCVPV